MIKDLSRYLIRLLPSNRTPPTYNEVVECERELLIHFKWDLMILIPSHFLRAFLANGIVFDNEQEENTNLSKKVQEQCHALMELAVKNNT
mmetsp:Transcript_8214/g.6123  ORF Transcript_8214/g.6123 Transcript_8214/m.6123 type:complete len:90 (-) Transcript_8214:199-468(-)